MVGYIWDTLFHCRNASLLLGKQQFKPINVVLFIIFQSEQVYLILKHLEYGSQVFHEY